MLVSPATRSFALGAASAKFSNVGLGLWDFESQRSDRNEKRLCFSFEKKLDLTELKVFERNLIFLSGWKKEKKPVAYALNLLRS